MKKKGFTLIELLAVIVILAVIALILTPMITDLIASASEAAFKQTINGILSSAENYITSYSLDNNGTELSYPVVFTCDGVECKDENGNKLLFNGKVPISGTITITENSILAENLCDEKNCGSGAKDALIVSGGGTTTPSLAVGTTWDFNYNGTDGTDGSVQTFKVPATGTYKLEVCGAQGGGQTSNGGYGGYSVGEITLRKNETIYVTVGGSTNTSTGGYNGGGTGNTTPSQMSAGGGGATHIATATGELSTLADNKQSVIIAAGGGGGEYYYFPSSFSAAGGHAGGYKGNDGNVSLMSCFNSVDTAATGGNQTTGGYGNNNNETYMGAFGQGGSAEEAGAGGGGGYYGGGGTYNVGCSAEGAAGGSGFIATNSLINKKMVCYNCAEDKENEETYTEKTTCANETPQESCAKIGTGYAKITFIR